MEVKDGFTVRYQAAQHRSESRTAHFTWNRLNDLMVFQTAGRELGSRRSRHEGMWAKFPNGHQDFFRALGFTLDKERASSLSVDEVPEGIHVSYVRPDPNDSVKLEKWDTLMHIKDIEVMLEEAQSRRGSNLDAVQT
jgi:hypothetical protein